MAWGWGCGGLLPNDERFILFQIYPPIHHRDPLVLAKPTHGASKLLVTDESQCLVESEISGDEMGVCGFTATTPFKRKHDGYV
ncbi:hypothetical protein VNO80_21387 [Phaseolus coccineus]|uniref:Uncharacterized protein n=1 Tax=Phaseolus coccineus TaxID=3886 RepID=A0AAN9QT97_PHACN